MPNIQSQEQDFGRNSCQMLKMIIGEVPKTNRYCRGTKAWDYSSLNVATIIIDTTHSIPFERYW